MHVKCCHMTTVWCDCGKSVPKRRLKEHQLGSVCRGKRLGIGRAKRRRYSLADAWRIVEEAKATGDEAFLQARPELDQRQLDRFRGRVAEFVDASLEPKRKDFEACSKGSGRKPTVITPAMSKTMLDYLVYMRGPRAQELGFQSQYFVGG